MERVVDKRRWCRGEVEGIDEWLFSREVRWKLLLGDG